MDKILPDMRSGHIKLLNLGHLRNLTLTEENLVLSMAETCKIDKLIVMNENRPYIQEILSNENIKEVSLYGQDYQHFYILGYVKQKIFNDMSKREYHAKEFLDMLRYNKNLRFIKCSFYVRPDDDKYQEFMFELLLNYKIERIQNLRKGTRVNDDIELIVDRNNRIWNDAKKKALNFIAIRKFRCNYENINDLEGVSIYLAQLPKDIILDISKHVFTLTRHDISQKQSKLRAKIDQ